MPTYIPPAPHVAGAAHLTCCGTIDGAMSSFQLIGIPQQHSSGSTTRTTAASWAKQKVRLAHRGGLLGSFFARFLTCTCACSTPTATQRASQAEQLYVAFDRSPIPFAIASASSFAHYERHTPCVVMEHDLTQENQISSASSLNAEKGTPVTAATSLSSLHGD